MYLPVYTGQLHGQIQHPAQRPLRHSQAVDIVHRLIPDYGIGGNDFFQSIIKESHFNLIGIPHVTR